MDTATLAIPGSSHVMNPRRSDTWSQPGTDIVATSDTTPEPIAVAVGKTAEMQLDAVHVEGSLII